MRRLYGAVRIALFFMRADVVIRADHPPEALPGAVVYPRSTEDVSNIMRTCNLFGVPVVAYAGGTSLEGNFSALQGGEMPFSHQKSGKFPQVLNARSISCCDRSLLTRLYRKTPARLLNRSRP